MVLGIIAAFVALVLLVLAVAYTVNVYNQLVSLDNRADQAKQNIDVALAQRQDELSKLIDTAKQMMDHEEEVLTELTEARERGERAETPAEQAEADQQIRGALASFRARVEAYPDLKSNENMMRLQERISDLENQIADRREVYNEAATQHNTRIEQFPYVVFARQFGFDERELFEATEAQKQDVDVGEAFA